jgi:hypothetical protein
VYRQSVELLFFSEERPANRRDLTGWCRPVLPPLPTSILKAGMPRLADIQCRHAVCFSCWTKGILATTGIQPELTFETSR